MRLLNIELKDMSTKTDKLPNMTVEQLECASQSLLSGMIVYMMNEENFKVPPAFLHARQVGAELNCAILRSPEGSSLMINPTYIVQDEKFIVPNVDYNVSYRKEDGTPQAFMTIRATEVLAMFDVYTAGKLNEETKEYEPGTFARKSEVLKGDEAIWYQHICDISEGKLLTRFDTADVVIDEVDGAQMEIGDITSVANEFVLEDEIKPKDD